MSIHSDATAVGLDYPGNQVSEGRLSPSTAAHQGDFRSFHYFQIRYAQTKRISPPPVGELKVAYLNQWRG